VAGIVARVGDKPGGILKAGTFCALALLGIFLLTPLVALLSQASSHGSEKNTPAGTHVTVQLSSSWNLHCYERASCPDLCPGSRSARGPLGTQSLGDGTANAVSGSWCCDSHL